MPPRKKPNARKPPPGRVCKATVSGSRVHIDENHVFLLRLLELSEGAPPIRALASESGNPFNAERVRFARLVAAIHAATQANPIQHEHSNGQAAGGHETASEEHNEQKSDDEESNANEPNVKDSSHQDSSD